MVNKIDNSNSRKLFFHDFLPLIKDATKEDKDIILTVDFNNSVGEYSRKMAKILVAGK